MFLVCCLSKVTKTFKMNRPHTNLIIRFGKPVYVVSYSTIKRITFFLLICLLIDLGLALILFYSSIKIRRSIGYYINMISDGDGDVLPSYQAIPVLFCSVINSVMIYLVFKSFSPVKRSRINRFMFIIVLVDSLLILVVFLVIINVISHSYSEDKRLHDGIMTAIRNYSTNPLLKSQIDMLQIEFQCCGSQGYDDWYKIKWFDVSLMKDGISDLSEGNTPFSCCSIKSIYPCIHHRIEMTGNAYLYTPEYNLSISTNGCYEIIRKRKQEIGWQIVRNLFLYSFLQILTNALFRFLQTGHFEKSRFDGNRKYYTIWLFGCYTGKAKADYVEPPEPPLTPPSDNSD